ncbi:hypothetical protein [Halosaccharopolyspora lacisalsi]|nr:hypothetical protein [Halosaccharopolyspora lacisalsi]
MVFETPAVRSEKVTAVEILADGVLLIALSSQAEQVADQHGPMTAMNTASSSTNRGINSADHDSRQRVPVTGNTG